MMEYEMGANGKMSARRLMAAAALAALAGCGGGSMGMPVSAGLPAAKGWDEQGVFTRQYGEDRAFYVFVHGTGLVPADGSRWSGGYGFGGAMRLVWPSQCGPGVTLMDFAYQYMRYNVAGGGSADGGAGMLRIARPVYMSYPFYVGGGLGGVSVEHPVEGKHSGPAGEVFAGWHVLLGNIDVALEGGYFVASPDNVNMDSVFGRAGFVLPF